VPRLSCALTIIADTTTGPVPMAEMGSGQNWRWCHFLAHLALHKRCVDKGRPVPRFLILDQPTQVYYPAERDAGGSLDVLKDADRGGVVRIFRWLKARGRIGQVRPSRFQIPLLTANSPPFSGRRADGIPETAQSLSPRPGSTYSLPLRALRSSRPWVTISMRLSGDPDPAKTGSTWPRLRLPANHPRRPVLWVHCRRPRS
jgi:hypothetical protein